MMSTWVGNRRSKYSANWETSEGMLMRWWRNTIKLWRNRKLHSKHPSRWKKAHPWGWKHSMESSTTFSYTSNSSHQNPPSTIRRKPRVVDGDAKISYKSTERCMFIVMTLTTSKQNSWVNWNKVTLLSIQSWMLRTNIPSNCKNLFPIQKVVIREPELISTPSTADVTRRLLTSWKWGTTFASMLKL